MKKLRIPFAPLAIDESLKNESSYQVINRQALNWVPEKPLTINGTDDKLQTAMLFDSPPNDQEGIQNGSN